MGWEITDQFVAEWHRIRAKIDGASGIGLFNNPHSLSHTPVDSSLFAPNVHQRWEEISITGTPDSAKSGRYLGQIYYGGTNNDPDVNLQPSDLGNLNSDTSVTVELWNLGEIAGNGGSLGVGQIVAGYLNGYNKTDGRPIYLIPLSSSPTRLRLVDTKWTDGTQLGIGWYQAKILTPISSDLDPTVDAVEDDLGTTDTDSKVVLALNAKEVTSVARFFSTSQLPRTFRGWFYYMNAAGDFKDVPIFEICDDQPQICDSISQVG